MATNLVSEIAEVLSPSMVSRIASALGVHVSLTISAGVTSAGVTLKASEMGPPDGGSGV